jgi:formylglycine-generating enzyme required for sulfatase activity
LQLAALLASSARIEPGLLRAVRHVLPADQADIETELDLWMDDRLIGNRSLGIAELAQEVRLELKEHAQTLPLAWRTGAAETIRKWHDGHTEILKAEEMLDAAVEQFRSRSREVFLGLLRYLRDQGPPSSHTPLGGYLIRSEERRCRADWEVDSLPIHAAVWGLCHLAENGIEFDSLLPDGLRLRDIAWILGGRTDARKGLVIHKGNNLHFISANRSDHAQSSGGCVLASFTFRHPDLQIESRGDEGILRQSRMVDDGNPLPLPGRGEVEIESVGTTITLSSSFVPGWATECERTSKGLWVGGNLPVAGGIRVPWPDETLNIGQDPHGVWLDITLSNACTMRLRWIPAGTFRMGSPEEEVGRYDDEVAHNVTITHGFWLGETLCTQVQWRAVMSVRPAEGEGSSAEPSHFKGDDRPVETVTWDECREFCTRLQRRISSLNFRLPTEAEWEYACRAGTETFFSGGLQYAQPTGKDPALDQLGWFAENSENETHPVKGKEVNTWGLFDMHGNVFEWCEDRADWREIAVATDTYEQGIADPLCRVGAWRVVRGGSFLDDAGYCRSASRDARGPGDRDQILGFRLAAGQKEASGAWGPAAEGAAAPGSREATSAAGAHAERARGEGSSPSG